MGIGRDEEIEAWRLEGIPLEDEDSAVDARRQVVRLLEVTAELAL